MTIDRSEQEAAIWAILEPGLVSGLDGALRIYTVLSFARDGLESAPVVHWCARLGNGPEHFGESRLDALAQLAQAAALR